MPKYDISVSPVDGNAFSIMGAVSSAIRSAGATQEEVEQYLADSTSGDYNNLLRVAMEWVDIQA